VGRSMSNWREGIMKIKGIMLHPLVCS